MSGFNFSGPRKVPLVKTKYRRIKTEIPVKKSLPLFEGLSRYEARSMHGQMPVVWDHAEDFQVFDIYGNVWIDFTSTIFVTNAGHSNPRIIKRLRKCLDKKLLHTYTFAHDVRLEFLKKLVEVTPAFCEKAFLLSAGTEATECAVKLMRLHGQMLAPQRKGIVSFKGSMHGRTMGAEMLKGSPATNGWIGYADPNIFHLPFPYPWLVSADQQPGYDWAAHFRRDMEVLRKSGVAFGDMCGFMIESYQGWGAIMYPPAYIQELVRFAREHHMLVTFDEIQGGFGRTGKMFVYEHYNVEPDLLCLGKSLTGSLPLSAVIGRAGILDLPDVGSMSSTHSANPLCCAAALANLEEIVSKKLVKGSERKGRMLHQGLLALQKRYPEYISYVLGKGMVAAVLLVDPETGEPGSLMASRICEKAMQKGLLMVHTGRESIKIGPPLTIPDAALNEGLAVLAECFAEVIAEGK
ncbi:MAG: aminotransferase class III-fold pyridoxal phosphate-dependent enzyme [Candidatus Omnitrophica bacterium]|nr:aminotransferase class III-fold pyridoxal phosphate-dependent enzyme [Candidatus Omnitrophota bacterium]